MMACRGMGAISPSKMPKGKKVERKDDPNTVDMYKRGGKVKKFAAGGSDSSDELAQQAKAMTAQANQDRAPMQVDPATGRYPVMDVSKFDDSVRPSLRYLSLGKDNQTVAGRLNMTKKLGKDAMLQAYLDADISRNAQGVSGRPVGGGVSFTKNFAKGGKPKGKK